MATYVNAEGTCPPIQWMEDLGRTCDVHVRTCAACDELVDEDGLEAEATFSVVVRRWEDVAERTSSVVGWRTMPIATLSALLTVHIERCDDAHRACDCRLAFVWTGVGFDVEKQAHTSGGGVK